MKNSQLNFFLMLLALSQQICDESISLKEEEPVGTTVLQLDLGIEYSIVSEDLYRDDTRVNTSDSSVFYIDSETHSVKNLVKIDRDTLQGDLFKLQLARTNDLPEVCHIIIDIIDVNDNTPTFDQDNVQVQISENAKIDYEKLLTEVTDSDEHHGLSADSFKLIG